MLDINYADGVQFHIDILPAIPDARTRCSRTFLESMQVYSPSTWSGFCDCITEQYAFAITIVLILTGLVVIRDLKTLRGSEAQMEIGSTKS